MFHFVNDHAVKCEGIEMKDLELPSVCNSKLSTSQRYLWPHFCRFNSTFYIADPNCEAQLCYLIPVAKCFINSPGDALPIVVVTDSRENALLIQKSVKIELNRQRRFCSLFNVENSVHVSDSWRIEDQDPRKPFLCILHGQEHISYQKLKVLIFNAEEVDEKVRNNLLKIEKLQKEYGFQIIVLCHKFNSNFAQLLNWDHREDTLCLRSDIIKCAVVCGPSQTCLMAPIRHFAYLINNQTVLWSDVLIRIVENIDCNLAIFCESDSDVNKVSHFLDSNCIR